MANVAVSEKSLIVLNYLKEIDGARVTAEDIAKAVGMNTRSVNGIITSGLIKNKGLVVRVPAEIEVEGGLHKPVNFIELTDAGRAYDHEAAQAQDAAAKATASAE
jgi:autonomous glycyl radical cofactor GrcA